MTEQKVAILAIITIVVYMLLEIGLGQMHRGTRVVPTSLYPVAPPPPPIIDNGGWVRVDEKLPGEIERVIVTLKNGMVLEGLFAWGRFNFVGMSTGKLREFLGYNPVIAWQPLPKPYKEENI